MKQRACTTVELVIVIVLLSAITVGGMSWLIHEENQKARRYMLRYRLSEVRRALARHFREHGRRFHPGGIRTHRASPHGRPVPHTSCEDAFVKQLTTYSDVQGNTCDRKGGPFRLGPYLRAIPLNPLPTDTAEENPGGVHVISHMVRVFPDAEPRTGWKYSLVLGIFNTNHPDYFDDFGGEPCVPGQK